MLANYNKILPKIGFHATTRGRCCSESSFSSFYTRSKLFFQHDHPNSYDLFFSSIDVCICVGHNCNQPGKGVKYRVTMQNYIATNMSSLK